MARQRITIRGRKAEATRSKIFDTAISLFEQHGYDEVTVDEICEKASVSKGTFYHYFPSKDQVIVEFFMQNDAYFVEAYERISKKKSSIDQLTAFGQIVIDYILNNIGLDIMKPIYYSQLAPGDRTSPMALESRPLYRIVEKIVSEGQEKGEIRNDISSHDITQLLTITFRGLVYEWCLNNGELDVQQVTKTIIQLFSDSLRALD